MLIYWENWSRLPNEELVFSLYDLTTSNVTGYNFSFFNLRNPPSVCPEWGCSDGLNNKASVPPMDRDQACFCLLVTFQPNRFDDFWQPHNLIFPGAPVGSTKVKLNSLHQTIAVFLPLFFPECSLLGAIWNVLRVHLLLLLLLFSLVFFYLQPREIYVAPSQRKKQGKKECSGPVCSSVCIKRLNRCKIRLKTAGKYLHHQPVFNVFNQSAFA